MGFTERVTHLTDYERGRRATRLPFESTPTPYRPTEPRSALDERVRADHKGSQVRVRPRRAEFEPGHPRHVPETWPTLLSRDQLCAYIGVGVETITKVCPVRPLDMGASLVRYSRAQIDEWVATLPPRLMVSQQPANATAASPSARGLADVAETRVEAALDRVRARAGGSKWRKTA